MPPDNPAHQRVNTQLDALIKALLSDRPIAYHAMVAKAVGSATAGILLSQFLYWTPRTEDPDGWFYKTQADIADETALTRWEQETARDRLKSLGVVEEKRRGVPGKIYFRVDFPRLQALLLTHNAGKPHSTMRENHIVEATAASPHNVVSPQSGEPSNYNAENHHSITEITSENTLVPSNTATPSLSTFPAHQDSKFRKGRSQDFSEGRPSKRATPPSLPALQEELGPTPKPAPSAAVSSRGMTRISEVLQTKGVPPAKRAPAIPRALPAAVVQAPAPQGGSSPILPPSRRPQQLVPKAEQEVIQNYLIQAAEEFHDQAPKFISTTTRVLGYYLDSGLQLGPFTARMEAARRRTKDAQRGGVIRKKGSPFPYYLSLLEEELGLREAPTERTTAKADRHQKSGTTSAEENHPSERGSYAGKYSHLVEK